MLFSGKQADILFLEDRLTATIADSIQHGFTHLFSGENAVGEEALQYRKEWRQDNIKNPVGDSFGADAVKGPYYCRAEHQCRGKSQPKQSIFQFFP